MWASDSALPYKILAVLYLVGDAEASGYASHLSHTGQLAGWMCTCVLSWREHFGILFGVFHVLFSTENNRMG